MINTIFSKKNILFDELRAFLKKANETVLIFAPFVKKEAFEKLTLEINTPIILITKWDLDSLKSGVSDIEIYQLCKEKGIYIFINPRIHLKAFIVDSSSCFFGSANITDKGLARIENYNYELLGKLDELPIELLIYFKKILHESILVDDEIYGKYKEALEKINEKEIFSEPLIENIEMEKEFLISALPMSKSPKSLFEIYKNRFETKSQEDRDCAIHDVVIYDIPFDLDHDQFMRFLETAFFSSPFVKKLLEFIDEDERYFGQVKEWIQKNCTDVPIPSRRDLTGNIQVLYRWIVDLSHGKYQVDRPNYSERIFVLK